MMMMICPLTCITADAADRHRSNDLVSVEWRVAFSLILGLSYTQVNSSPHSVQLVSPRSRPFVYALAKDVNQHRRTAIFVITSPPYPGRSSLAKWCSRKFWLAECHVTRVAHSRDLLGQVRQGVNRIAPPKNTKNMCKIVHFYQCSVNM